MAQRSLQAVCWMCRLEGAGGQQSSMADGDEENGFRFHTHASKDMK